MRTQSLSAVKAGITRLREKGGATPDSLYDLVNGFVTAARTIRSRPGSECEIDLPAGQTKGLVLFRGKFVVFASEPVDTGDPDYLVEILKHPDPGSVAILADIRFAAPFLGYLYVVAKWSDGRIVPYWLQASEAWQPNHAYRIGEVVQPTVPNGFAYRANRIGEPGSQWEPDVARTLGEKVEPTVYNGFEYTVIEVLGANPRSGSTEPTWPTTQGALVSEDTSGAAPTPAPPAQNPDPGSQVPPDVRDRYGTGPNSGGPNQQAQ